MKLKQLIKIASDYYDDDLILKYHNKPNDNHGDTLAEFIALELADTFDPNASNTQQLDEAVRVIDKAINQLTYVLCGLNNKLMTKASRAISA